MNNNCNCNHSATVVGPVGPKKLLLKNCSECSTCADLTRSCKVCFPKREDSVNPECRMCGKRSFHSSSDSHYHACMIYGVCVYCIEYKFGVKPDEWRQKYDAMKKADCDRGIEVLVAARKKKENIMKTVDYTVSLFGGTMVCLLFYGFLAWLAKEVFREFRVWWNVREITLRRAEKAISEYDFNKK